MGIPDDVVGTVQEAAGGGLQGSPRTYPDKGPGDIISSCPKAGQYGILRIQLQTGDGEL